MIRSSKLQSRFSDFKIYLKPVCLRMFFLGFCRPAFAAGIGHARLLAARGRH